MSCIIINEMKKEKKGEIRIIGGKWKGKKIYQDNGEVSLKVIKGVALQTSNNFNYEIDGLSGATLTCNGVSNLIAYWMGKDGFLKFINNLQKIDV